MTLRTPDFSRTRKLNAANTILQLVLLIVIFLQINYLGTKFYHRSDLTPEDIHSLSLETQDYLRQIDPKNPVRIFVTLLPKPNEAQEDQRVRSQVKKILREYAYHANRDGRTRLTVEHIDIYRDSARARELANQYNLTEGDNILIASNDRIRLIPAAHLKTPSDTVQPQPLQFRGEKLFTSAILHVIQQESDKVYILQGHGELLLDQADPTRGMTEASAFLQQRNITPEPLNLEVTGRIPKDAKLLIIASPQYSYTEEEIILLKDYLDKDNGRLLVLLDPYVKHGLDDIFREWGINVEDKLVVEPAETKSISERGTTLIRQFSEHPVTRNLGVNHIPALFGPSRPVTPDIGAPMDETQRISSLLFSREESWAENDYRDSQEPTLGPRDRKGPISLAAVSERQTGQEGIHIAGGKLSIFGNSKWVTNTGFRHRGNRQLLHNCILWNLDRYTLLNIPPRPIQQYELNLDKKEFDNLSTRLLLPSLGIFILGILCYITRRH